MGQGLQKKNLLGKGSFGTVYLVQMKKTKQLFAMKRLNKENITKQDQILKVIEEKNIMSNLKCFFIIQLIYAFQTPKKLYFVMEFMQGGEMFLYIRQERQFSEQKTRFYIAEIILALEYIHSKNIIYRDLKPENILINKDGHIKICDFGLSKQGIGDNETTKTVCGTPEYLAPEILRGKPHGKEVDWYSLGCIFYEFLTGYPPYYNRNKQLMFQNRLSRQIEMKPYFSKDASDIIQALLQNDPDKRLGKNGCKEIKEHIFFQDIDWDKLKNLEIQPPFVPKLKNEYDLQYISSEFKNQVIDETYYKIGITSQQQNGNTFQDFSYVNDSKIQ
ncbi:protein kinase domain protein [Ichthyophthirius multifiliis]|uniref:Protein kinase domain protein n=1 Tax=Ichthyophthirius multifiliis TaxID=5932 RepID=G0QVD3_ICHMU|nr:protein kinase domain protein [Ichthyophthirius multifiliis]EGR30822.1 protein kinase domain protein [Ichthyophthirius multifiliis]|eukprot:XP_004032409.1 protein kinase domain protein [Ichthyophthirius multifiliis]